MFICHTTIKVFSHTVVFKFQHVKTIAGAVRMGKEEARKQISSIYIYIYNKIIKFLDQISIFYKNQLVWTLRKTDHCQIIIIVKNMCVYILYIYIYKFDYNAIIWSLTQSKKLI